MGERGGERGGDKREGGHGACLYSVYVGCS